MIVAIRLATLSWSIPHFFYFCIYFFSLIGKSGAQSVGAYTPYVFGVGNHETDKDYHYRTFLARYGGQYRLAEAANSPNIRYLFLFFYYVFIYLFHLFRYLSFDVQLVHFVMYDTDAWVYPEVFYLAE